MNRLSVAIACALGLPVFGCGSAADTGSNATCPADATQCGASCIDIQTDNLHCGACDTACTTAEACIAGTCVAVDVACPTGTMLCGTTCLDLENDRDNCGACDMSCGAAATCEAHTCALRTWQPLAPLTQIANFPDYVPTESVIYDVGAATDSFALPDMTNPTGLWTTTLAAPPTSIQQHSAFGWIANTLYTIVGSSVYAYDIAGNTWTTPVAAMLTHVTDSASSTADDSGYLYATADDRTLIQLKVADSTVQYFTGPLDLSTSQPRTVWDSKTQRVYLAGYGDSAGVLYAFNPTDGTFTKRAHFPDPLGYGDAMCSDRKGHLFTTNTACSGSTAVWMYDSTSDAWSQIAALPVPHGCDAACTVSADGWLYFGDSDASNFLRIQL